MTALRRLAVWWAVCGALSVLIAAAEAATR